MLSHWAARQDAQERLQRVDPSIITGSKDWKRKTRPATSSDLASIQTWRMIQYGLNTYSSRNGIVKGMGKRMDGPNRVVGSL